jgi:hypothetical protein
MHGVGQTSRCLAPVRRFEQRWSAYEVGMTMLCKQKVQCRFMVPHHYATATFGFVEFRPGIYRGSSGCGKPRIPGAIDPGQFRCSGACCGRGGLR